MLHVSQSFVFIECKSQNAKRETTKHS